VRWRCGGENGGGGWKINACPCACRRSREWCVAIIRTYISKARFQCVCLCVIIARVNKEGVCARAYMYMYMYAGIMA